MFFGVRSRPIRTVLLWQIIATASLASIAGSMWGINGALSTALGGLLNVTAGWVAGWLATRRRAYSAGESLKTMFRAEATKIMLIVVQFWLVLENYRDIVVAGFLTAFVITVLVSTAAIVVKEAPGKN